MVTTQPGDDPYAHLTDLSKIPPFWTYLRETWDRRSYAIGVPIAEYRSQNLNTGLGQLWHLLNPALQMGVYFLMFGVILDTDRGIDNFLMYLGAGLFSFRLSEGAAVKGAGAITSNLGLIRSIRFPRLLLPISATVGQLLLQAGAIVVLAILALATGEGIRWQWVLIVPVLALQGVFCLGLTCWTARFSYRWSDLPNLLPFMFRLVFYVSGVLYAIDKFIEDQLVRTLFDFNPFFAFIQLWRYCFMDVDVGWATWAVASAWAAFSVISGINIFKMAEGSYGQG